MAEAGSKGPCAYCEKPFTRGGMARHLRSCAARKAAITRADAGGTPAPQFHLQAQDDFGGPFWLQLEVAGSATLTQLDKYLRAIWLECCGHLSEFTAGRAFGAKVGKQRTVAQAFGATDELFHTYDFGSSSVTILKRVDVRTGSPLGKHPITLMARNSMPDVVCGDCGAPATFIVPHLMEEGDEPFFCDDHVEAHADADEYGDPLPVVNSPRSGVCGYAGPAEPPY
jgi:hypothetical protein